MEQLPFDADFAFIGSIQSAEEVEQRALAGSAGALERGEPTRSYLQTYPLEHLKPPAPEAIGLVKMGGS